MKVFLNPVKALIHRGHPAVMFALACLPASLCPAQTAPGGESAEEQARIMKVFRDRVSPFVTKYCKDCHGDRKRKAGVTFSPALKNPGSVDFSKQWKQALAAVKTHAMPPDDTDKQPSEADRQMFSEWVASIKYLYPEDPGYFVIRRLTKAELGNTLHDLYGVDPAIVQELPDDVGGEGYLNSLSPLQMEQYLGIANQVLDRILAPKDAPPTPMQKRLFGPPPPPENGTDLPAAARKVARSLARDAYRRPVSEAELDVLMKVFELGRQSKLDYDSSLRLMLKAILVSPQFLYITPAQAAESGRQIVPLDDHQLASRLSYFLWATMPDARLMALADRGELHQPEKLKAQVKRMLADPRSRALFDGFGAQWLGLVNLNDKTFDTAKFPQMTRPMRAAMYDEARLFFQSIVRENRSVAAFVDCDYTFLNETLAPLYGLEKSVTGPEMRKVQLADANRGGILGMPGILAMTSLPNRTSPVKRGVWVLEQVLGQEIPPPPPNVPELEKQDQKTVAQMTLRQRTELHRTDPVCANCHNLLDPIGFGLENFDAIGRWRTMDDTGGAIDAEGELPGGKHFKTPRELKAIIASRAPELARNLTEKLLAYALCRKLEGYDEIVVDQLMPRIAQEGYGFQAVVTEIVASYPFTHRRIEDHAASKSQGK